MSILTKALNENYEINNIVGLALIRQFEERFPDDKDRVLGNANNLKKYGCCKLLFTVV